VAPGRLYATRCGTGAVASRRTKRRYGPYERFVPPGRGWPPAAVRPEARSQASCRLISWGGALIDGLFADVSYNRPGATLVWSGSGYRAWTAMLMVCG